MSGEKEKSGITFENVASASKARNLLKIYGVESTLSKASVRGYGCAYTLLLGGGDFDRAKELLDCREIKYIAADKR